MAILFRSCNSAFTNGAALLTITKPAGVVENDLMIAQISIANLPTTITTPGGWTLIRELTAVHLRTIAYYKVAGDSEPADYTWTFSGATTAAGGILAYQGVDASSPVNIENGQATPNDTSHATPSVNTTRSNCMLVTLFSVHSNAILNWTPPAAEAERFDISSMAGSDNEAVEGNDETQAVPGATGAKTATSSGAGVGTAQIIALQPPVVFLSASLSGAGSLSSLLTGIFSLSAALEGFASLTLYVPSFPALSFKAIVTIHGHPMLAELPTANDIDRLYTLSGRGAFSFRIPASDPGANQDTIQEGRLVAIRSTTGLPAYLGHIRQIKQGPNTRILEINGDNLACVLYERQLPLDCTFTNQAAGIIAMQLLRLVNSTNATGIWSSTRSEPGTPIRGTIDFSGSWLGNALDELAKKTGDEWWLEQVVERNKIEVFLRWGRKRGSDKSGAIHLQEGIHFAENKYIRDALGFAQSVTVIGGGATVADRPAAVRSFDRPSSYVGKGTTIERGSESHRRSLALSPVLSQEVVEYLPLDEDEAVLSDAAQKALENPLTAAETFDLTINDILDWSLIEPGDIVRVILANVGFGGVSRRVRILAMQPDEDTGEMDLAVEVEKDV